MNGQEKALTRGLQHRENFIELLFPIAIGTGFAEHVASILLHKSYDRTTGHALLVDKLIGGSGFEIALLFVSMLAVTLSWNWYIPRIRAYPLDTARFILDIVIVSMYLILLVSSWLYDVWFVSLAVIWWLYLAWDIALYNYSLLHNTPVAQNFARGVTWAVVLSLLAAFHHPFTPFGEVCAFIAALSAVIFYRIDQMKDWGWRLRGISAMLALIFIAAGARFG